MVAISSLLLLIGTVALPAVASSMFTIRQQNLQSSVYVSTPARLADLESQKYQMTANFLQSAYAVVWLGKTPPAFSTNEYALAPFAIENIVLEVENKTKDGSFDLEGATITSTTVRYWSELTCWPPASISINYTSNTVSFDDGHGCNAENLVSFNASITDLYDQAAKFEAYQYGVGSFGYDPFASTLHSECPDRPHLSLATWRAAGSAIPNFAPGGNATAMFCQPEYYFEPVVATVRASNMSVEAYKPIGARARLSEESFNRSHFEYVISNGAPPTRLAFDNLTLKIDLADAQYVQQRAKILNLGVITPMQSSKDLMIGFALGLTHLPLEKYLDFDTSSFAYENAHKLLFAHAMQQSFEIGSRIYDSIDRMNISSNLQPANRTSSTGVSRLVPGFTITTELILALILLICGAIFFTAPGQALKLIRDPDSLAEVMLLARSAEVQQYFARLNSSDDRTLNDMVRSKEFHLDHEDGQPLLCCTDKDTSAATLPSHAMKPLELQRPQHLVELSWSISGLALSVLIAAIVLLCILFVVDRQRSGLGVPSESEFLQQLILNFIPTAAATLLGIYLVLLCRIYSFIKPMHDLWRGNVTARSTLLVNYTSIPPQTIFFKAFGAKHFVLGSLSVTTLLSNVLTVTTANIFSLQRTEQVMATQSAALFEANVIDDMVSQKVLPGADRSSTGDALYSIAGNMTGGTNLPPWTTSGYGFIPAAFEKATVLGNAAKYILDSTGYGAELECQDLFEPRQDVKASLLLNDNGRSFQLWANYTMPDGTQKSCVNDNTFRVDKQFQYPMGNLTSSISAVEISYTMDLWNGTDHLVDDFCRGIMVKGWVRAKITSSFDANQTFRIDQNATIIDCKPRMKTQDFRLNLTSNGDILSSTPIGPLNYIIRSEVNLTSTFNISLKIMQDYEGSPTWHNNDSIARDWSNTLYKDLLGNRDWLNPALPPPSPATVIPIMSDIFGRVFATQLHLDQGMLQPAINKSASPSLRRRDSDIDAPTTKQAQAIVTVQKVFMSRPNLIISVIILVLDLVVLVVFRLSLPKPFLPRMPFTIASQIAFFAGSHVIDDVVRAGGDLRELDKKGYRYAYGQYIGKDGWLHTGIERDQFVTKL